MLDLRLAYFVTQRSERRDHPRTMFDGTLQTRLACKQVIVSLHAATGATMGSLVQSRTAAALLGIPLHIAGDRVPHRDIPDRRFEIGSGLLVVVLVAARRGLTDKATIGAVMTCLPDLEHVIPLPRPGGSKLFHGRRGWHRSGPLSASAQLLIAAALLGRVLAAPRHG